MRTIIFIKKVSLVSLQKFGFVKANLVVGLLFLSSMSYAVSSIQNLGVHLVPFQEETMMFGFGDGNFSGSSNPIWPLQVTNVDRVHELPKGQGEGVRICLIDTGVNLKHPALAGAISEGMNFLDEGPVDNFNDENGHGTWLATLIAGRPIAGVVGVAPKATLVIAKVLDGKGNGNFYSVVKALSYCRERSDIINMSMGSFLPNPPPAIIEELAKIKKSGKTLVGASGNGGGAGIGFPSSDESVLAISSVTSALQIPQFAPRNLKIAFVAPGVQIPILMADLTIKYYSGSSFSAAYVSGVEALRRSRNQNLNLRARTLGFAPDLQGQGLIDAYLSSFDLEYQ